MDLKPHTSILNEAQMTRTKCDTIDLDDLDDLVDLTQFQCCFRHELFKPW